MWRVLRLPVVIVLLGLTSALDAFASEQVFGAKPAALESPYKPEREWAVGETVTDLAEMVRKAAGRPYAVAAAAAASKVSVPRDPDVIAPLAIEWLGPPDGRRHGEVDFPQFSVRLTALTATALADSNAEISAALSKDMRDAKAPEAAALVLGAVASALGGPASENGSYVMGKGIPRGQPLPEGPSVV